MKKKAVLFTCTFITLACSFKAMAEDVNLDVEAKIQEASLNAVADPSLNFGEIIPGTIPTVIEIDASGTSGTGRANPAITSGVGSGRLLSTGAGSGRITITPNLGGTVGITYPADGQVILTGSAGGSMPVDDIQANSTPSPVTVTAGNPTHIHVGGELTVGVGQTPGDYTGTATIGINYQ